jgi:hypothetical protein
VQEQRRAENARRLPDAKEIAFEADVARGYFPTKKERAIAGPLVLIQF